MKLCITSFMVHFGTNHCTNSRLPTDLIIAIFPVCTLSLSVSSPGKRHQNWTLSLLSNDLQAIIRDYVGWSLTGNRKQKNMCNFWPKKWSRSLKKFEWWSLTRELLKQYLTEKQNGCLRGGRLREVVAYEKWSLWESWLYIQGSINSSNKI